MRNGRKKRRRGQQQCLGMFPRCSQVAVAYLQQHAWRVPQRQQLMGSISCMQEEEKYVDVGLITSCHGVRGEVKVQPLTDSPKRRFGRKGAR